MIKLKGVATLLFGALVFASLSATAAGMTDDSAKSPIERANIDSGKVLERQNLLDLSMRLQSVEQRIQSVDQQVAALAASKKDETAVPVASDDAAVQQKLDAATQLIANLSTRLSALEAQLRNVRGPAVAQAPTFAASALTTQQASSHFSAGVQDPAPYSVVGDYPTEKAARKAGDTLSKKQVRDQVIVLSDSGFSLMVGQYSNVEDARRRRDALTQATNLDLRVKDQSGRIW